MYNTEHPISFHNLKTLERSDAGSGLWLMCLLPLSIVLSGVRNSIIITGTYKLVIVCSLGSLFSLSIAFFQPHQIRRWVSLWLNGCFMTLVFYIIFNRGILFAIYSGILSSVLYYKLFEYVLQRFPKSFTLGEGMLATQGALVVFYSLTINLWNGFHKPLHLSMQISTTFIQVAVLGITLLSFCVYYFDIQKCWKFYVVTVMVVVLLIILPLYFILDQDPILWILLFLFENSTRLKMVLYWSCCCGLAILAVNQQILGAQKATTSKRKIFHVLIVLVYVPGIMFECSLLYLASGLILALFLALELLRIMDIPPFGKTLQESFLIFCDEKDQGILALTPIYLLVGCSLPLWIHPAPCDVTDSGFFNMIPLLSGLLTIGIGDMTASIVGSHYGKFKWNGSNKTIEGTVACILSEAAAIYFLLHVGFIPKLSFEMTSRLIFGVILTSFVEAKTSQMDNLVLPLIMYIILI